MSIRCHTTQEPRASLYQGWGATGAVILATTGIGGSGPGLLYPGTTTADNATELSFRIVAPPAAGLFTVAEDGSFTLSGAPGGTDYFTFEKYDNQTSVGQATSTINVGSATSYGNVNLHPTLDGRAVILLGSGLGVTIPAGQMVWVN